MELIEDALARLRALAGLPPHFTAERIAIVLSEAIAEAVTWGDPFLKRKIYRAIALRLTPAQLDLALAEVQTCPGAADALAALAPHLSEPQLDWMLRLASSSANSYHLRLVLEALAPHLSATQLDVALTLATADADARNSADVLISLLPHLPERSGRTAAETVIELCSRARAVIPAPNRPACVDFRYPGTPPEARSVHPES
ncbi:hypothetical protein [Lentzea guizhouensis]|uniref:hypothetical protein n=1 Tax=Lentzea guizhouensis TaxID=1586287 RepID=UPI0012B68D77|nr:hypothetical protein [Lentzea guizhouensis]